MTSVLTFILAFVGGFAVSMARRAWRARRTSAARSHGPFPYPGYGVPDDVPILPGQRWEVFGVVGEVIVRWIGGDKVGYRLVDATLLFGTQDCWTKDFRRVARPVQVIEGRSRVVLDIPPPGDTAMNFDLPGAP